MRISTVLMSNRIEEIITSKPFGYESADVVWHWFTSRRYGLKSKEQFEDFLIKNFDGLQVYRLLALYKEYVGWKKRG